MLTSGSRHLAILQFFEAVSPVVVRIPGRARSTYQCAKAHACGSDADSLSSSTGIARRTG